MKNSILRHRRQSNSNEAKQNHKCPRERSRTGGTLQYISLQVKKKYDQNLKVKYCFYTILLEEKLKIKLDS